MPNRYLIGNKKSGLSRSNNVNRYEGFIKEIPPSLKYESSDSRYTMPGAIRIPNPISTPIPTSLDCSTSGYWINVIEQNPQGSGVYPLSQYIDNQCNYFCCYEINSVQAYQKFDSSGNSLFSNYESNDGRSISEVSADSNGNLYVCYADGIRKLDSSGEIIWEKYFQDIRTYGVTINSNGDIFVNADDGNNTSGTKYIAKLDSEGNVVAQKQLTLSNDSAYAYTGPKIDSQNNVIWSIPMADGQYYSNLFIKFDSDLNFIWDTRLDPTNQIGDYDVNEFGIDSQGNIYANHYYNTIAKYDSNGDFVWAKLILSDLYVSSPPNNYLNLQGLGVTESGDVFYVGCASKDFVDQNGQGSVFYSVRLNTDGDLQSISYISSSLYDLDDASWNWSQAMTNIKNNTLNVCFRDNTGVGYFAKLPLNEVIEGTFGDFSIVDETTNPNISVYDFTDTSRISTDYTLEDSTAFDATFTKTYTNQVYNPVITNTPIA